MCLVVVNKLFFWKVGRRMGHKQTKEKTEGATGLGRITREQLEKWNQMTAVRLQTGGRHLSHLTPRGAPFGPT